MQRKIIAMGMLTIVLAAGRGFAGGEGWTEDLPAAKAKARAGNLVILMDFSGSDWCGWCIKLDKEVFQQPEFKKFAGEHLVLMLVDHPQRKSQKAETKKQNQMLDKQYGIEGFPTVILLDAAGNKIGETGYQAGGAQAYVTMLKKMIGADRLKAAKPAENK